jgi:type IV pilus assembly protein PilW
MTTRMTLGRREQGLSIVELMVAITIGLILSLVIGSVFVASTKTFRTEDDESRLQETARAALDVLDYHIRQAGYVDVGSNESWVGSVMTLDTHWLQKTQSDTDAGSLPAPDQDLLAYIFAGKGPYSGHPNTKTSEGIIAIWGCDGSSVSTSSVAPPWTCTAGASTVPDSITVTYQAQPVDKDNITVRTANTYRDTLSNYTAATGQGGDCGSKDVNGTSASPKGPLAINRFYVDTATNRLMCVGNGDPSSPQPIAEGVEFMRISYGVARVITTAFDASATSAATNPGDYFSGRYVSAAGVPAGAAGVPLWSRVLSVRVCLQIASPTPKVASNIAKYRDCDGTLRDQTDGKIRRTFTALYSVRNHVMTNPDVFKAN